MLQFLGQSFRPNAYTITLNKIYKYLKYLVMSDNVVITMSVMLIMFGISVYGTLNKQLTIRLTAYYIASLLY